MSVTLTRASEGGQTFESVSCVDIDLLCLGNLFQEVLDDLSIVVSDFTEELSQNTLSIVV